MQSYYLVISILIFLIIKRRIPFANLLILLHNSSSDVEPEIKSKRQFVRVLISIWFRYQLLQYCCNKNGRDRHYVKFKVDICIERLISNMYDSGAAPIRMLHFLT